MPPCSPTCPGNRRFIVLVRTGPQKASNAARAIKRSGLANFRAATGSAIGLSYADNLSADVRRTLGDGGLAALARWITTTYPFSKIYDAQVRLTESYTRRYVASVAHLAGVSEKRKNLLGRYRTPDSLLGGCSFAAPIGDQIVSLHYLNLLDQHDQIAPVIDFRNASSLFEIGGGFGANVHLLLSNYSNIHKVLYLDIPPTLYVATQYLKAFYDDAVADSLTLRTRKTIAFRDDGSLEILCIAPWQIEQFDGELDVFLNAHSFVEMPRAVVQNYVNHLERPASRCGAIALTSYDQFDPSTTLDPNELPKFFADREFSCFECEDLLDASRKNFFFVSPGRFGDHPRVETRL